MTKQEERAAEVRAAWDEVTKLDEWKEKTDVLKKTWRAFTDATIERSALLDREYRARGLAVMMRERTVAEKCCRTIAQGAVYAGLDAFGVALPVVVLFSDPDGFAHIGTNLHTPTEASVVFHKQFRTQWILGRTELVKRSDKWLPMLMWSWRLRFEIWRVTRKIHKEKKANEKPRRDSGTDRGTETP